MDEKRRIFCLITQSELGGAQEFVAQLAGTLDAERFALHVVWGSDSDGALARRLPSTVSHGVARNLVRAVSPLKDLRAIREVRVLMRAFRPDVVLCVSSKAGFIGARAAFGLRMALPDLRVIYRIGGWSFNDPVSVWKRRLYILMEKLSARWKDVIVVNNSHDLDQAHALRIHPRARVVRIFNGIDPFLPLMDRTTARAFFSARIPDKFRPGPETRLIGTVANFYPTKDLPTLIAAAARISGDIRFVIVGDGPQRVELERLIADYELSSRVFLVGRVTDAARMLPAFDAFVLPSVKEGFPWALLEAMAAKVPVVATRVGAVPEMIENRVSGLLVEPSQPDLLAAAIVELLGDEHAAAERAIRAHQQVITKFTLRDMVAQYEKLFS
ncbi:MAG TPA: glycosyltransferase [Candidatus Paceibacterota bacterium]|nr:glycosyltransferase [Candidatus Paceibacterota bacterium]